MFDVLSVSLRTIAAGVKVPVLFVLVVLIACSVGMIGWIIAEAMTERRRLKVSLPELLDEIRDSKRPVEDCIRDSGLLKRQKTALLEMTRHESFTDLMLESLAQSLIEKEQEYYNRLIKITDMIAKIGPMFGLLGTLIPLGPGIVALGQGDTVTLSTSLQTAFDTTIAGLIAAAICTVISSIRRSWYNEYMSILETVSDAVVEMEKEKR